MAEIHGDEMRPGTSESHPSHASNGFVADLKAHKIEVIIGGVTLLLTVYFLARGKSGAPAAVTSSGTGTLTGSGTNTSGSGSSSSGDSITAATLASALASVTQQEQADYQTVTQQLAAFGQTIASLGTGSTSSSGAGGIPGYPSGSSLPGGQGYPGSGPVVSGNGNAITNALQARNKLGDTTIINFFKNLSLPSWIGLQYVAENFALPWTPGSTPTSTQLSNFNNWLDSHGYRNASTNSFTSVVSSGSVPANVQSELNSAYGA